MNNNESSFHLQLTDVIIEQCPEGEAPENIYDYYIDSCKEQNITPFTYVKWYLMLHNSFRV